MFWITVMGLALSWMLIKLGMLSATANFLMMGLKMALALLVIGGVIGVWAWLRRRFWNTKKRNTPALE